MARMMEVLAAYSVSNQLNGGGTSYLIQALSGALYLVFNNSANDVVFTKSLDNGASWSAQTVVFAGSTLSLAVWYDRWSNISAGLIHCAYVESTGHNILYRSIDTESSDSLGTETTVFNGASASAGTTPISITRARGGNLVVAGTIDGGTEDGAWESSDAGATWGGTIADPSEGAQDFYLLLPGWNADTQDVQLVFWDVSADEISVKRYDDSGNSWAETSLSTGMVDLGQTTATHQFAAAVDIANSRNIVVAWSAADTANADLRCWIVDDTTVTEVTNVVQNSTDDQALCSIGIDTATGDWHVYYCGKSDGSETFGASTGVNIYRKISTDDGATWGSEEKLTSVAHDRRWLASCPRFLGSLGAVSYVVGNTLLYLLPSVRPRSRSQVGT